MAKTRSIKNYQGNSKYFFFNDRLVRLVDTDAVGNRVMVYDFEDHLEHVYKLSDFKKYREPAWTLPETCELLGRTYWKLYRKITKEITWIGTVATYGNRWTRYYFSKKDILDLHQYLADIDPRGEGLHPKAAGRRHYDKPKHKLVKRDDLPTREQLLASLSTTEVYYIKNEDGEFIPVFKPL